ETAPAAATRDMYVKDGTLEPALSKLGPLAAGVPGHLAGLDLALRRAGTRKLGELIAPSADLCERGFAATADYARVARGSAGELAKYPASRAELLKPDGS